MWKGLNLVRTIQGAHSVSIPMWTFGNDVLNKLRSQICFFPHCFDDSAEHSLNIHEKSSQIILVHLKEIF